MLQCDAKKACCHSIVVARLYEGIVVAAHLREANRDTPAAARELRARAEAMEAASPYDWRVPCVFLDARRALHRLRGAPDAVRHALRLYAARALQRSERAGARPTSRTPSTRSRSRSRSEFRDKLSLRKKVGRRYIGVLPRMVLVALEAWDRTDFRDYLRQLEWPTDADADRWRQRAP